MVQHGDGHRYIVRRPALSGSAIIFAHAVTVVWHLLVLAGIPPGLTMQQVAQAIAAINAVPLIALIFLWTPLRRLAGLLLCLALGAGLVAGGYEHFVGSDNIFRMAAGPWTVPFRVSAVLLLILEGAGCWIGIDLLRAARGSHAGDRAPAKSPSR
jgi:hypothetical protein